MPIKHLHKLQKYLPDVQYVNLYGPTEITCNCTYYVVDREFAENESLPIGVPFKNERILLLTPDGGEAVKPGEIGELCVSGTSVALGYYKDAERTAASWMSTSEQSCPSSTIRFTFSRWPMARDSRFSTAF